MGLQERRTSQIESPKGPFLGLEPPGVAEGAPRGSRARWTLLGADD